MGEPLIWGNATDLVPMSKAHTEDLRDIVAGTYGFEPGETEGTDFVLRYAAVLLTARTQTGSE